MNELIINKSPQNWQILQQHDGFAKVSLSGETYCNEKDSRVCIRVCNEKTYQDVIVPLYIKPVDNKWSAEFSLHAGGLYTITVFLRIGERELLCAHRILHIGVGDNYIIAGQSNASGNSKDAIADELNENIHLFRLSGKWDIATHPLHDATDAVFPDIYKEFGYHSPWLAFAKILNESTGYPIGLIPTAVGGTPLSFWNRKEDGHLFESMLKMVELSGVEVKGVLWYQGCNDAGTDGASTYLERFTNVCKDFEKSFYEGIPIITVQINKQTYRLEERLKPWSVIREAQRQAAKSIENVYVVPTMDLPLCDTIHNCSASSLVVAQRASNVALKYIYGRSNIGDFPNINRANKLTEDTVRLYFDNVIDSLSTDYLDVEDLVLQIEDEKEINKIKDIAFNQDNTVDISLEREIVGKSKIGCDNLSYAGGVLYDVLTRYPMIAFDNVKIES